MIESSNFEGEKSRKNAEYINSFKVFVLSFQNLILKIFLQDAVNENEKDTIAAGEKRLQSVNCMDFTARHYLVIT